MRLGLLAVVAAAIFLLLQAAPRAFADPIAHPTLTTAVPSATTPVGGTISDTATLAGGIRPGGTIVFTLYRPSDPLCIGTPVFRSTKPVDSPTVSAAYAPRRAGVYSWVAAYSGDANNMSADGQCGDPHETVQVSPLTPSVIAVVQGTPRVGASLTGAATLRGGYIPSGTVTFSIYGVDDATCTGPPVFSQTVPVGAQAISGRYNPPSAGTYRLVAAYSGDRANTSAESACGDPRGTVVVTGAGQSATPPPPTQPGLPSGSSPADGCLPQEMAGALTKAIAAALTGEPGSAFKATCAGGVRIVLRSREIRPGFTGIPKHNGYTTIGETLTEVPASGQIAFSINPQGIALRRYAKHIRASLTVFVIVHVTPRDKQSATESVRVFTLPE